MATAHSLEVAAGRGATSKWFVGGRRTTQQVAGDNWRSPEKMAAAGKLLHAGICRMRLFDVGTAPEQEDDGEREAAVERRERLEVPRRKL